MDLDFDLDFDFDLDVDFNFDLDVDFDFDLECVGSEIRLGWNRSFLDLLSLLRGVEREVGDPSILSRFRGNE